MQAALDESRGVPEYPRARIWGGRRGTGCGPERRSKGAVRVKMERRRSGPGESKEGALEKLNKGRQRGTGVIGRDGSMMLVWQCTAVHAVRGMNVHGVQPSGAAECHTKGGNL